MKLKRILNAVLALTLVSAMSVSALAVNKEYAVETPANQVIEEQFPVEFINESSNGRVRRGVNTQGTYYLVKGNDKDSMTTKKFKMNKLFKDHNTFSIHVDPTYGSVYVEITGDNGYVSKSFWVTEETDITVKNAKSDVKYKVTFSLDLDDIEAQGSYEIVSKCSK